MIRRTAASGFWAELAAGIRKGDDRRIEDFCGIFHEGIRFRVMRELGSEALADHVKAVLITVVGAIRHGQLDDPERLVRFTNTTVRQYICRYVASHPMERCSESNADSQRVISTQAGPSQNIERSDASAIMRDILINCGRRDREILRRFYVLGRTKSAIAREMKLDSAQVRNLTSRVKQQFAERYKAGAGKFEDMRRKRSVPNRIVPSQDRLPA